MRKATGRRLTPGRVLLTGASGQVGWEVQRLLTGVAEVVAPTREEMDMSRPETVRAMIRSVQPRWIVNPAAYTAVDKAESEPALAFAVNAEAVRAIGEGARAVGAGVVQFSTDYVFDGAAERAYREEDATRPMGVYGASKLAGERALDESGAGQVTLRTSWVYGARGRNFLLTILKLARERESLRVVSDQHGAPTWSRDLAGLVAHAIARVEKAAGGGKIDAALREVGGIYHASGAGETTWHGFATEAVRMAAEREPGVRFARIEAIPSSEYPTPARRPENSLLDCTRLEERWGWRMMEWRASLAQVVAEL